MYCSHPDSKVLDSRPDSEGRSIRRRRECLKCGKRWRSVERLEDEMPLVVKKNGTFQPYDRDRLFHSMSVACGKRPVAHSQLHKVIADLEWEILERHKDSVSSRDIGESVMSALKSLDEIAYIRYASVYRRFKDAGEMIAEMKDLLHDSANRC